MRSIPVDLRVFDGFTVSMMPEARVANLATGEVRKDRSTGETVYQVGIVAMRGRQTSVELVSVVGEPKGLSIGMQVRLTELEGSPWEVEGRSGLSWRAASIQPLSAPSSEPDLSGPAGRRAAGSAATGITGALGSPGRGGDGA